MGILKKPEIVKLPQAVSAKIAVGYVRVSSREQVESGISIDAQISLIKKYCEDHGWYLKHIYMDKGISAGSIKKRKDFSLLLKHARTHDFEVIVITKMDRAFRNVLDALQTSKELVLLNIDLAVIKDQIDTTTALGRFFFVVMNALSELERELTSERIDTVLQERFNKGILVGKMPIGYKPIFKNPLKRELIIGIDVDPELSKKVLLAFEMTANNKPYNEICAKLKISPQSYYNMLKNDVYLGIVEYKGQKKKGEHKPIISQDLWDKVHLSNSSFRK